MKNYGFNGVKAKKKKKRSFLKACVYTITSIALVVASVVGLSSIKPNKKIEYKILDENTQDVNTITIKGDVLTEDMLADEVEEGKVFSGWYYDDNYTLKAKVGDKINGNITLYSRQMSLTEGAYWARVDNQLNAVPEVVKSQPSPFEDTEGKGTAESPYIISTQEDMGVFSRVVNETSYDSYFQSAHYQLANDIRLDTVDVTWPAVGSSARPFYGYFDGNGHMVKYIYGTKGFFNYVGGGEITNLTIKGLEVSATETVGGLVSYANCRYLTIKNCTLYGDINSTSTVVGGLIGEATGTTSATNFKISNCSTYVRITYPNDSAESNISGIVAKAEYIQVEGCVNNGIIESNGSNVGGLIAYGNTVTISYSINAGRIVGKGNVGGLVGVLMGEGSSITNSFNRGSIEASGTNIGGLIGLNEGTVSNTYNVGSITAKDDSTNVSGIVGNGSSTSNIDYSYSLGNVTADNSDLTYNPISNGDSTVDNCGYNNNLKVGDTYVDSADQVGSKYPNASNLYDKSNSTSQSELMDSLNESGGYTNVGGSGITWSEVNIWIINIIDFSKGTPDISEDADFSQTTNQVTYYVNGLKKMVVAYKTTEGVTAPNYKGHSVTYYTDSLYKNAYTFGNTISSALTLYGKCKTLADGVEYTVSIDSTSADVTLDSASKKAINGNDYTTTLVVNNGKTVSSVQVVMENNSSPNYTYNASTNMLTVYDVVGNIVITPVTATAKYTINTSGLVNMTASNTASVSYGGTYTTTLSANTGYNLPSTITVTMGGKTLSSSEYTYSNGQLSVPNVNGNITISGTATIKSYTIDTSGLTNITLSSSQTSVNHGNSYNATLKAGTGYTLPSSITIKINGTTITSGYTYTQSSGALTINSVTGNITIVASAVAQVNVDIKVTDNGGKADGKYSGVIGTYTGEDKTITISYDYDSDRYYNVKIGNTYVIQNSAIVSSSAYKNNVKNVGTYSFTLTGTISEIITVEVFSSDPCLVEGTWITLANGKKKKIEDITYDDEVLVWDFDKGCFTKAKPFWIKIPQKASAVMRSEFSDGSVIETVRGHAVYNIEENMFMNTHKDAFKPGYTHTFNEKGERVLLVKKEIVYKEVNYYNFHTMYHMNNFSNGILTSIGENNLYPIKDMKFVKEERELIPYEEFEKAGVPRRYYDGLRLAETPRDLIKNRIELVKELLEPVEVKYEEK